MHISRFLAPALIALSVTTSSAIAQDSTWDFNGTFYLWTAETDVGITTPLGDIESTLSFSDALENLDFAFMAALEARNGKLSLIGDFAYTKLAFSNSTPGPNFGGVDADVKLQVMNAYALYETRKYDRWALDLGAGVRWFNADTTLSLLPGNLAGRSARFNDSWFDPVIAGRVRFDISDRWSGNAFLDYGGFRSGSESWQAILTARYDFNDSWSFVAGYRILDIKHGPSDDEFNFTQSGPVIGVGYAF